jgi:hypothetical protein
MSVMAIFQQLTLEPATIAWCLVQFRTYDDTQIWLNCVLFRTVAEAA